MNFLQCDIKRDFNELEYAGFWIRVWASIIDSFLILIITIPIISFVYGADYYNYNNSYYFYLFAGDCSNNFLISYLLPAAAIILFWIYCQATPGKMAISAKIVDANTGKQPSIGQFIGRYFAYIPAFLFFGLGILWVAFDKRKQGWHDKLAGTVVVRKKTTGKVRFEA
jgi:uncharacterized RDD family membrane protein YckC